MQQKQENFLHLVTPARTPEQLLDLEFTEAFLALDVGEGGERPRRFHKIAAGELFPVRLIARVVQDGLVVARTSPTALFHAIADPIRRYIERKFQQRLPRLRVHRRLRSGGIR